MQSVTLAGNVILNEMLEKKHNYDGRVNVFVWLTIMIYYSFSCVCSLLARGGTMELEHLQERYMSCLRSFVEHSAPQQPNRFHDLLVRLPEVS